jgi:hypothetical protein
MKSLQMMSADELSELRALVQVNLSEEQSRPDGAIPSIEAIYSQQIDHLNQMITARTEETGHP